MIDNEEPDESTGAPGDEVRRPPAPPAKADTPAEESASSGDESTSGPETPSTLGDNEWLDPNSERHRRRRHTQLTRRRDRLRRKWRRWRRKRRKIAQTAHWYRPRNVFIAFASLIALIILTALISAYVTISGIRRAPLMPVMAAAPSVGTNILLLSSDGEPAALALDPNTLVVQFVHVSANYQAGQVIDLPSNLLIPHGKTQQTIGDIYTSTGVVGLVGALQADMNLTINHVVQTSFRGYAQLTDDLGGLALQTETGMQQFTGAQARTYVSQVPAPEIGLRFQHWSKALMKGMLQPGVLLNPFTLWSLFSDSAGDIVVDDTLDNGALVKLVWHLKSLTPSDLHFFTAPHGGNVTVRDRQLLSFNANAFGTLSQGIRQDNLSVIGLYQ